MRDAAFKSSAFRNATLKSESYRSAALLCLLAALSIFVIVRGLAVQLHLLVAVQVLILAVVIVHEVVMRRAIKRALREDRDVSAEKWVLNVLIESQIPTVTLFLLLESTVVGPSRALIAPAILVYFLVIILSILRLSPTLTVLTGILSAVGYLFVTFYAVIRFQNDASQPEAIPLAVYLTYAGLIVVGGILAAFVASRIRTHVLAALREAEYKNELDQINHDLDVARSIQQGLFPEKSPTLKNFELAGWNQPANETGGDYFDWQTLPDGQVAISLGDATGHGIGPALVSVLCRAYARASLVADGEYDQVLDRLNHLLSDDLSANRFVTFALVFLDPAKSEVQVLSAGHGPILHYKHESNELENLEAQGIPLGMIPGVRYEKANVRRLAPNDMLILVTDGFYEWANPKGEEFGLDRLNSVILQSHDCSPEEVIVRLRSAVEEFCGGTKQQDDLTAVVLKRNAKAHGEDEPEPAILAEARSAVA